MFFFKIKHFSLKVSTICYAYTTQKDRSPLVCNGVSFDVFWWRIFVVNPVIPGIWPPQRLGKLRWSCKIGDWRCRYLLRFLGGMPVQWTMMMMMMMMLMLMLMYDVGVICCKIAANWNQLPSATVVIICIYKRLVQTMRSLPAEAMCLVAMIDCEGWLVSAEDAMNMAEEALDLCLEAQDHRWTFHVVFNNMCDHGNVLFQWFLMFIFELIFTVCVSWSLLFVCLHCSDAVLSFLILVSWLVSFFQDKAQSKQA